MSEQARRAARAELEKLPGMKEDQLRQHTVCSVCGSKVFQGSMGLPLFWIVKVERWGLDGEACNRQQGLGMLLGGRGDLARVMGPDEDLARQVTAEDLTVCEQCAMKPRSLFELAEAASKKQEGGPS